MEVAYLCSLQHQLGLEDLPKSQAHVASWGRQPGSGSLSMWAGGGSCQSRQIWPQKLTQHLPLYTIGQVVTEPTWIQGAGT